MNKSVLTCLSSFVLKNFITHAISRSVALWDLNRKVSRLLLNSLLWFLMSNIRYLGESAKPGTVPKEPGLQRNCSLAPLKAQDYRRKVVKSWSQLVGDLAGSIFPFTFSS